MPSHASQAAGARRIRAALVVAVLILGAGAAWGRPMATDEPAVVAVAPAADPSAVASARAYAADVPDGRARVLLTRTLAEQLGVLHRLALRGVPIATFGLHRRASVAPVRRHVRGARIVTDPRTEDHP